MKTKLTTRILIVCSAIYLASTSLLNGTTTKETTHRFLTHTQSTTRLEMPAPRADIPEQILHRSGYTVSYNKERMQPNWVAWHITAEHTDGPIDRKGHGFHEDAEVPEPRATTEDYKGCGKIKMSRGHMCPAGDCKWSEKAMDESFLLTNCCPQSQKLNTGLWSQMEKDSRRWAEIYGDIYVVCGPMYPRANQQYLNRLAIPSAFFKIILRLGDQPAALAFVCKNDTGAVQPKKHDMYYNTIDEIERLTGYDFFPSLPDEIENKVESVSDRRMFAPTSKKRK